MKHVKPNLLESVQNHFVQSLKRIFCRTLFWKTEYDLVGYNDLVTDETVILKWNHFYLTKLTVAITSLYKENHQIIFQV